MRTVLPVFAMALLAAASGCTTTRIDQYRQGATSINQGQSIVVLGRHQNSNHDTAGTFVQCIGSTIAAGNEHIRVVPEHEFTDAMFPYFEPRTAPMHPANFRQLMGLDQVRQRMQAFGIEYLVWIDGSTQRSGEKSDLSCSLTPAGGGCFGFGTWQDDSKFEAEVWDMHTLESVGSISTTANGHSYLPALIVPIPLIAQVEASACSGMGNQIKQFILGNSG